MEWLRNLDWGAIVLVIFGLGFLWLVVKAVRKMRAKREDADESPRRKRPGKPRPAPRERPKRERPEPTAEQEQEEDDETGDAKPSRRGARPPRGKRGGRKAPRGRARSTPADEPTEAPHVEPTPTGPTEQERLSAGLAKTRGGFVARLGKLFAGKPTFDETLLEQVEEVLFTADIGTRTADELIQSIRKSLGKKETDPDRVFAHLKARSAEMLRSADTGNFKFVFDRGAPFVLLMVGVNGTGKTTTIGKIAAQLKSQGKKVLLAAGDTFRAAAAEQLEVWAKRSECDIVRRPEGADPSAVIVDALKKGKAEGYDVVICDTAGRLHTKVSLMEELKKIPRSMAKHVEGAPHETFLVLDATTGQNAITQAKMFREALEISGLVLTKLDGTAKGGVVLGISHELGLPVRFVGIGEKVDDLRRFDPDAFVEALYEREMAPSEEQAS